MKRSALEVEIDILRAIFNGQHKPTRIMYACNTNWIPLKSILNALLKQGAINKIVASKRDEFYTTARGRNILKLYDGSIAMLKGVH
jgi:predicted transcriptional regulator